MIAVMSREIRASGQKRLMATDVDCIASICAMTLAQFRVHDTSTMFAGNCLRLPCLQNAIRSRVRAIMQRAYSTRALLSVNERRVKRNRESMLISLAWH